MSTMASANDSSLHQQLCELYRQYRGTKSIDAKADFFSPECHQICRTEPSYAAQDRGTIIRYLLESGEVLARIYKEASWNIEDLTSPPKSFYTMRPLTETETSDFGAIEALEPAGFSSVEQVQNQAQAENWAGLRVNMWTEDDQARGILVKVQYWWRKETSEEWKQILHDIMYLGPVDGTERDAGGELVEDK
ncbi:Ff.00g000610.m01.CDS01 [Fusarium sp. VM40]|nr:Ff.00g000610.m01.CDS01 [Fusarium sp. VM40]